ncbi:MAG TPA: YsnF/AvaK domain-containing protein [Urbifossiella sp.]|nr:YsnF/AvaK domain-containing protein [Urbifossiella sp.]
MPTRNKKTGAGTVVGVFATRTEAEAAVRDLRAAGFADADIGLVGRNADGKVTHETGDTNAGEGAVIGAAAGAGALALGSLAVTFGVIPVIGPILAVGPLAAALISAGAGAAAGGLAGALIGWGIPEDDAGYYEGEVKAGRYLVTVNAAARSSEAWDILHRNRGYNRSTAAAATGTAAGRTMELKEEELEVSKRPVKKGEVEVRKEVVTEQRQITVPVEREEVVIQRRPVHGKAAAGDMRAEEIRIPVSEEEVEVHKKTKVKEEVSVGKRKVADTKTVGGTVRHEELRVEEEGNVEVRGNASTTRKHK